MGDVRYMGPGVCFGGFGEEFDAGLGFLMEKRAFFVDSFEFGLISLMCCSGVSLLYHGKSQLGGGFKYFLFSSLLGEIINFDWHFSTWLKPPTRQFSTTFWDAFFFGTFSKHKTVANPRCDWTNYYICFGRIRRILFLEKNMNTYMQLFEHPTRPMEVEISICLIKIENQCIGRLIWFDSMDLDVF